MDCPNCDRYDRDGAEVIESLKKGDEVVIPSGIGNPAIESERTDIVAEICCFSALTAGGIKVSCYDGTKIQRTGRHFDSFELSPEAIALLTELGIPDFFDW